jgi:hypothetical protein
MGHPKPNFVSQMDLGAFRAGHLDLPIVEDISAGGLLFGQFVRFHNLDAAGPGGNVFGISLNDGRYVHEIEHQIVRDFVWSEIIDRADQHGDLCHDARITEKDKFYQSGLGYRFVQVAANSVGCSEAE